MFLESSVFVLSSRPDLFLSTVLVQLWSSCGPFGALLWLFLACFGTSEGPCWALLGTILLYFGALVAFGVCVLRGVVDFSCCGGHIEAFRGVSEAFGGHFGGQKPSKTIEKPRFFEGFWKTTFSITRVVQSPS